MWTQYLNFLNSLKKNINSSLIDDGVFLANPNLMTLKVVKYLWEDSIINIQSYTYRNEQSWNERGWTKISTPHLKSGSRNFLTIKCTRLEETGLMLLKNVIIFSRPNKQIYLSHKNLLLISKKYSSRRVFIMTSYGFMSLYECLNYFKCGGILLFYYDLNS